MLFTRIVRSFGAKGCSQSAVDRPKLQGRDPTPTHSTLLPLPNAW